jgi:hypothetical protein
MLKVTKNANTDMYLCTYSSSSHIPLHLIFKNMWTASVAQWLTCSIVGSSPGRIEPKTIKLALLFSAKHAALRRKNKDRLSRNHNNVSVWNYMSTRGPLFQWAMQRKCKYKFLLKRNKTNNSKIRISFIHQLMRLS